MPDTTLTSSPNLVTRQQAEACASVARHLRAAVGDLVRSARGDDQLAPAAAGLLDLISKHGPLTTAELAALRQVRHQTVAASVADLVEAGLVAVAPHPVDRRKKLNELTVAGRAALDADAGRREAKLAEALAWALTKDELSELQRSLDLLNRVVAALDEGGDGTRAQFITGGW